MNSLYISKVGSRGVINGKNGKTAVLPKYSDSFIHIINKKVQKLDSSPSILVHSNPWLVTNFHRNQDFAKQ